MDYDDKDDNDFLGKHVTDLEEFDSSSYFEYINSESLLVFRSIIQSKHLTYFKVAQPPTKQVSLLGLKRKKFIQHH